MRRTTLGNVSVSRTACAIALINALAFATPAFAQSAETEPVQQQIIVTGSRIASAALDSPNPVTVVGAEQIQSLGQTNVAQVLQTIPQNSAFVTDDNVGLGNFNVGAQLANLRGLNPFFGTRTLTLVDSKRFVPSTNGGAVDLNLIPSVLVERVEVVTGGASAIYGTDAIAGVVNVILNKKMQGLRAQLDYGVTEEGDGEEFHGALAAGTSFAGGAGNIVVGGEYSQSFGIGICSQVRDWCKSSYGQFTNTGFGSNGQPNFIIGPNALGAGASQTGVFAQFLNAPGVANMQFNAAGNALVPFDPGEYVSTPDISYFNRQGGDGGPVGPYDATRMRPPVERFALYGHLEFEVSPAFIPYIDISYGGRSSSNVQGSQGASLAVISADNAFLTPDTQQLLADNGGIAFFNRNTNNIVDQVNATKNTTFRVVAGADGTFAPRWNYGIYYTYGRNDQSQRLYGNQVTSFFGWALDAVIDPETNQAVCRQVLLGNPAAAGCQPLNLFGSNNASQAAIDYAYRTLPEEFRFEQQVVAASVTGDLFDGIGAGPVGVALGAEYRHESGDVSHLGLPYYNDFLLTYGNDFSGKSDIYEIYGEVSVPLLQDSALGRSLEVDAAVRHSWNTSTSGVTNISRTTEATTYKFSLLYDPIDEIRLRASHSRDIRSPGFRELYYGQVLGAGNPFASVNNPFNGGAPDAATLDFGGSVLLTPETADTWTAGIVLTPFPRFRASVDWYQIKIRDAIGAIGQQVIVDSCFAEQLLCDRIEANDDYTDITYIDNNLTNLNGFTSRGLDVELAYSLPLGGDSVIDLRTLFSYIYNLKVDAGGRVIDYAGQSGPVASFGDFNTTPKLTAQAFLTYRNDAFTAVLSGRYVGKGRYNATYIGPDEEGYSPTAINSISDNSVDDRFYTGLALTYRFDLDDGTSSFELFGTVSNLLNVSPPVAPGGNGYPTNPVYFDTAGRSYRMGVRVKI
ncbi:TonB-dependent receptor [Altererythrobacter xixiisoli]|uniref:TonB-dependent receptor n=1 Tax=Croceibacterium xixiisoli TaxID=1476466 RepID=A0A6I4TTS7_9SPHN|nr:TonB-dependent receptor [Croceibacterium xixiisoli]MXO98719.1 TonB-dependent receptor [Croceibacterium xixiisoli]